MRNKLLKVYQLLLLYFCSLIIGCSTHNYSSNSYNAKDVNWTNIQHSESDYYKSLRGDNIGNPKTGLALSGGGQRSASVSIGFLQALHENGVLDKIDTISSVSGGSYAAYWWYTKNYWAEKLNEKFVLDQSNYSDPSIYNRFYTSDLCKEISPDGNYATEQCFKDDPHGKIDRYRQCRFYFHNYNHGYLLTFAQERPYRTIEFTGKLTSWLFTTPIHWAANGLFDMKLNVNLFQNYYGNGIERDYGLYPTCSGEDCEPLRSYANPTQHRLGGEDPQSAELFDVIKQNKLPFWVINTTAAYSKSSWAKMFRGFPESGYSESLANTVYEFTPTAQGSPRFGFTDYETSSKEQIPFKLSRMVEISGAAIDSLSAGGNVFIDTFNLSLGQYIDNPNVKPEIRAQHRLLPFPFYLLHENRHDESSPFIYLSDGGHADNLGIYSLLRRGVKNIIVLDNEHEKDKEKHFAEFDSLHNLNKLLLEERNYFIDIEGTNKNEFNFKNAKSSILKGVVCKKQNSNIDNIAGEKCDTNSDDVVAEVYYVKLSVNSEKLDLDSFSAKDCIANQAHNENEYSCDTRWYASKSINASFPQDPTSDIFYSPTQFSGYVALGYDLGRMLSKKITADKTVVSQVYK